MQDIELNCPHCGRRFSVLGTLANAEAICPGCVKTVKVPSESQAPLQKPIVALPEEAPVSEPSTPPRKSHGRVIALSVLGIVLLAAAGAWYMTFMAGSASGTKVANVPINASAPPVGITPEDVPPPPSNETTTPALSSDPQLTETTTLPPPTRTDIPERAPDEAPEDTMVEPAPAPPPAPPVDSAYMAVVRKVAVKLHHQAPMAKRGAPITLTLVTGKEIVGTLDRTDETSVFVINEQGDQTRIRFDTLSKKSRLSVDRTYRKSIIKALAKRAMSS